MYRRYSRESWRQIFTMVGQTRCPSSIGNLYSDQRPLSTQWKHRCRCLHTEQTMFCLLTNKQRVMRNDCWKQALNKAAKVVLLQPGDVLTSAWVPSRSSRAAGVLMQISRFHCVAFRKVSRSKENWIQLPCIASTRPCSSKHEPLAHATSHIGTLPVLCTALSATVLKLQHIKWQKQLKGNSLYFATVALGWLCCCQTRSLRLQARGVEHSCFG